MDITGFGSIANMLSGIFDKVSHFIPDPVEKAKAQQAILELQQRDEFKQIDAFLAQSQQQADINLAEAKSTNWFVAGWRPFVGWVCGSGFAYGTIIQPFIQSVVVYCSGHFDPHMLPPLYDSQIHDLLLGMLGMGGLRTYEKFKGVESRR